VSDSAPKERVILRRGNAVLALEGVDSVTNTTNGIILTTDIGATTARRLSLQAGLADMHSSEQR
jgi:hypothetical protein